MSIMTIFQASRPDASLWTKTTVQFTLPYFSISIGLNILLTLLLVGRLLYISYNTRNTIGKEHASTYISIASMLVESATPYAITGLIFIITYARNSNVQNLVLPVLSQIMVSIGYASQCTISRLTGVALAVYQPGGHHLARRHGSRSHYEDDRNCRSSFTGAYQVRSASSCGGQLWSEVAGRFFGDRSDRVRNVGRTWVKGGLAQGGVNVW